MQWIWKRSSWMARRMASISPERARAAVEKRDCGSGGEEGES
jgi:hypothetical protein